MVFHHCFRNKKNKQTNLTTKKSNIHKVYIIKYKSPRSIQEKQVSMKATLAEQLDLLKRRFQVCVYLCVLA